MNSRRHYCWRALAALPFLACASEHAPTAPLTDSTAFAVVPSFALAAVEPSQQDLANMPAVFSTPPSILGVRTSVGFTEGPAGVWAQGSMEYFATDAEQDVTLVLRQDDRAIYTKTAKGSEESFLPRSDALHTMVSFTVSAACGVAADGGTAHRAFHKFLVGSWKYFSWGHQERPSGGNAELPPCRDDPESSGSGSGGGGGNYDTGCESCQQWFWYENGEIVDEWWECTPIDGRWCDEIAT